MPDTLLHWHCEGVTYSVKRLPGNRGFLIVAGPGEAVRHGKRPLPESVISEWAKLPIPERCAVVDSEIARRRGEEFR